MKKMIIPTGYMGSGSSAITDLISEFQNIDADFGTHEYVFMHTPGGLFDLEDKLLLGNNAIRSDEALHVFRNTMAMLYDKKYWWVGNYKETFGEAFLDVTDNFIKSIITTESDQYWYYQENTNTKMWFQLVYNRIMRNISFNKYKGKKPLLYKRMWLSLVDSDTFYTAAKEYLNQLFLLIGLNERDLILDQLLLPFNLHRFENYFDKNVFVVVVSRDPRDTFIINKYVYNTRNEGVPYPIDVYDFCKYYRAMRKSEKPCNSDQIIRLNFESLCYDYENTLELLKAKIGLDNYEHVDQFNNFDPDKSILNTQLFVGKEEYQDEVAVITELLSEYLFDFPYEIQTDLTKTF